MVDMKKINTMVNNFVADLIATVETDTGKAISTRDQFFLSSDVTTAVLENLKTILEKGE